MFLALDEDDTMTPTERELMAEVGDEGESKTVTLVLFDFEFLTYEYISWPDMYRGHLTKTNMRTRCLASV